MVPRRWHEPITVWCGPDDPPRGGKISNSQFRRLDSTPNSGNVNLQVENISSRLVQDVPSLVLDLLEIGSYVYAADQSVSRGGGAGRGDGRDWYRNFIFEIPVRNPDLWNREDIRSCLEETLGLLTEDHFRFCFRPVTIDIPRDAYFPFDEGQPWFKADSVLMFSGGLDSLSGALHELTGSQNKVILVSHRPVATIAKRQRDLVSDLHRFTEDRAEFLHVPVWVNKDAGLTVDANQRSRSFLYAMLGAAVAHMVKVSGVRFYENGIVSTNLPIAPQVLGTRASRSTHPQVLRRFSELLSLLFEKNFEVSNPFFWKTKSDVIGAVRDLGARDLIAFSNSCNHTRQNTKLNTHCGVCSQCIERRLAALYCGLDDHDPFEMYAKDLFLDPLEKPYDRSMVESYVRHGMSLKDMTSEDFVLQFGEVQRIIRYLGLPTSQAAERLWELHRRHGEQVTDVVEAQISRHADLIANGQVEPTSLLGMIVGESTRRKVQVPHCTFPTVPGLEWEDIEIEIVSNESVRIKTRAFTQRYTGFQMGFADERKKDILDTAWDLLREFAEGSGQLTWVSRTAEPGKQKLVQRLNKKLRGFFQLTDNPIPRYRTDSGWVTRFKITDCSLGKG